MVLKINATDISEKYLVRTDGFNIIIKVGRQKDWDIEDRNEKNRIYYEVRTGTRSNNGKQSYVIIFHQYRDEKSIIGNEKEKDKLRECRKKFFEDDREFVEQIINEKNEIGIIEEKTAKNEMVNQRNLFKVFIDETNEDTVCEFFREFVERFNVRATDTHKDEYVIFRD